MTEKTETRGGGMMARAWHEVTEFARWSLRALLWLMVIEAVIGGAGWLAGSLHAGHALNADEFTRFMESLPVIGSGGQ